MWDVECGTKISDLASHRNSVRSVTMSKDMTIAASSADNGEVMIWNLQMNS